MKTYHIIFIFSLFRIVYAQNAGNVVYTLNGFQLPESNYQVPIQQYPQYQTFFRIKGLANIKADSYTAIFSVKQMGDTASETNEMIDNRIQTALAHFMEREDVSIYIDMISFVPVYTYEEHKKTFSKRTYTEVPSGFEMIKNIHIRYSDHAMLNSFIAALASQEIYDLVRIDYFSTDLDAQKEELKQKAYTLLENKITQFKSILEVDFSENKKQLLDGFKIVLPVEQYQSYVAYSSGSIDSNRWGNVQRADKSKTLYYQPILDKEFDFVMNPTILEPVIQVIYEIDFGVYHQENTPQNKYYIIDSQAQMHELNIQS